MRTNRRALIIGIQNYKTFGKLDYAKYDAELINEVLHEYQCQFACTLLLEEEATARNIRTYFRNILVESDDDAVIVFFFAGHGVTIDNGTFLVTLEDESDTDPGVHLTRLIEIVKANRKPHQSCIFLLDCCHAGALPVDNLSISLDSLQETLMGTSGVVLIAATEETALARESTKLQNGIFTHWLFQGLVGGAADHEGKITIFTLYDFISAAMAEYHKQQNPVFKINIVGASPILGDGFVPRNQITVSKLDAARLYEINIKVRERLQHLQKNLNVDPDVWAKHIYRETSAGLAELIVWRGELENSHPELKNDKDFHRYDQEITSLQIKLAILEPGIFTTEGEIIGQIGMGGFGTVYEIKTSRGIEAYKAYHANQLHDRQKLKSFRRGYRAMKKLDHSNIVKVTLQTYAPEGFYMQYIDGPNFRDWWNDDIKIILDLLHLVAQSLEYAHLQGIVHRDIKPENIIIDVSNPDKAVPYLTDFDLSWYSMATTYSTLDNTVVAFGHYLYAAPEQYERPEEEVTRKSTTDVYGFGQLCYFAICGTDPARDTTMSIEGLKEHVKSWAVAEAAQKFIGLYAKCVERSPAKRFQSMSEVSGEIINIRNLLLDPDQTKAISEDEFINELMFSLFGFEQEPKKCFLSRSGVTQIDFRMISNFKIEIKFDVIQGFTSVSGKYGQQRNTMNRRIDTSITELSNKIQKDIIRHREDIVDTYSTRIEMVGNYLTLAGVADCREVLRAILTCIESG